MSGKDARRTEIGQKIKSVCSQVVLAHIMSTLTLEELAEFEKYVLNLQTAGPIANPDFFSNGRGFDYVNAVQERVKFVRSIFEFVEKDSLMAESLRSDPEANDRHEDTGIG